MVMTLADVTRMTIENIHIWLTILLDICPPSPRQEGAAPFQFRLKTQANNFERAYQTIPNLPPNAKEILQALLHPETKQFDWYLTLDAHDYLAIMKQVLTLAKKMLDFEEVEDDFFNAALSFNSGGMQVDIDINFLEDMKKLRGIIKEKKRLNRFYEEDQKMLIYAKLIKSLLDWHLPANDSCYDNVTFRKFLLACMSGQDIFLNILYTESALTSIMSHVNIRKNDLNCIMLVDPKECGVEPSSYDIVDILNAVSLSAVLRILFRENRASEINGIHQMLLDAQRKLLEVSPIAVAGAVVLDEKNQVNERYLMVGRIVSYLDILRSNVGCAPFLNAQLASSSKKMMAANWRNVTAYDKRIPAVNIYVMGLYKVFLDDMVLQSYMLSCVNVFSEFHEKIQKLKEPYSKQQVVEIASLMACIASILEDQSKMVDLNPTFYHCLDKSRDFSSCAILDMQIVMAYLWLGNYRYSSDIKMLNTASIYILKVNRWENKLMSDGAKVLYQKIETWLEEINFHKIIKDHLASLLIEYQEKIEESINNIEAMESMPSTCKGKTLELMKNYHHACLDFRVEISDSVSLDRLISALYAFKQNQTTEIEDIKKFLQGKMPIVEIVKLIQERQANQRQPSPRREDVQPGRQPSPFWNPRDGRPARVPLSRRSSSDIEHVSSLTPAVSEPSYSQERRAGGRF